MIWKEICCSRTPRPRESRTSCPKDCISLTGRKSWYAEHQPKAIIPNEATTWQTRQDRTSNQFLSSLNGGTWKIPSNMGNFQVPLFVERRRGWQVISDYPTLTTLSGKSKHRTSLRESAEVLAWKYGCFHQRSPMFLISGSLSPKKVFWKKTTFPTPTPLTSCIYWQFRVKDRV